MMKNPFNMNFLLFIGFLVIGYSVSTKFFHPNYAFSNGFNLSISTNSNSIQSLKNGQRNFLVILVDKLDPYNANLESIWLVTNLPLDLNLQIFPIYPTGSEPITAFEEQLVQSFKLENNTDRLTIGKETIEFLKENNFWWSGYFIIESESFPKLLESITPSTDLGKVTDMDGFISYLNGLEMDPQNEFDYQLARMQNICLRLSGVTQSATSIRNILTNSNHLVTNLEADQLEIEWNMLISNKHNLNCTFPTLEISQVNK